jgi:hypothetical protein
MLKKEKRKKKKGMGTLSKEYTDKI